jgi:GAF domain-containing protein
MQTRRPHHPPPPPDEDQRLAALAAHEILDTPKEPFFEEVALLAAGICRAPMAAVAFVDEGRVWFKAELGLGHRETSREDSFSAYALLQEDPLIVGDAAHDRRFVDGPLVRAAPRARFYAGAQIHGRDGYKLGALEVLDLRPRDLDEAQRRALLSLAVQIEAQLELRLSAEALREAAAIVRARRRAIDVQAYPAGSRVLRAQLDAIDGHVRGIVGDQRLPAYLDETAREILDETRRLLVGAGLEQVEAEIPSPRDSSVRLTAGAEHAAMRAALATTMESLDRVVGEVTLPERRAASVSTVARLTEAMAAIKQSADDTMRIMRAVDEIAFQTNLLALDAVTERAAAPEEDVASLAEPRPRSVVPTFTAPPPTRREPRLVATVSAMARSSVRPVALRAGRQNWK